MSHFLKLRNHSIRTQLIIGFLTVLIPLLIVLMAASYLYSSNIISQKTLEQAGETIEQFSISLDHFMEQNINKLEMMGDNPTIQEELNADAGELNAADDSFYSRNRQIRRIMLKEFSSVTMNDMELYGLNGASYYISVWSQKYEMPEEEELFRRADEAKGKWIIVPGNENYETLQMIKLIKDLQTYKPLGYVRIGLKRSYIDKLAESISFDSQGRITILAHQDIITSGRVNAVLLDRMAEEKHTKGNFSFEEEGKSHAAVYVHSNVTGWDTVGLIPMAYINKDLEGPRNVSLVLSAVALIIGIAVFNRIAKSLASPIMETAVALEQFSGGDFEVRLLENREDEIGKMNTVFNETMQNVKELMQKVTKAEILKKEMEFKTLQSQMNPHFLYNTLDAINWMAFKQGQDAICNLVGAISNLIRGSISNKQSIITLEQELGYVKDYLYIQQVRYHDRFEIIYNIDETLLSQALPKLVIQPIVENAVIHGLEGTQGGSTLMLGIQRIENDIDITVKDTGVGMPQERIESLLKEPGPEPLGKNTFHTSLGIYAVHKRLQFLYGERYGLRIKSTEGEGTEVTIHIPYEDNPDKLLNTYNHILGGGKVE